MKVIYTNKKVKIYVDDEDFEYLNQFTWNIVKGNNNDYAKAWIPSLKKEVYMHKLIFKNSVVDHIDCNSLNNQKHNLRECTYSENSKNYRIPKTNTSGYKGVSKSKTQGKYKAYIHINNKQISLGTYYSKEEAAKAYNEAAIIYHGKFARLNIIKENL